VPRHQCKLAEPKAKAKGKAKAAPKAKAKGKAKAAPKAKAKAKAKAAPKAKAEAKAAPKAKAEATANRVGPTSPADPVASTGSAAAAPTPANSAKRGAQIAVDHAWIAMHADALKALPADCVPQSSRVGRWSYTLRAPNSNAKIEVLLRCRAFYVKEVATGYEPPLKRHVPWSLQGSVSACWAVVREHTGYA
jgi:hypothetical protein